MSDNSKDSLNDSKNINDVSKKVDEPPNNGEFIVSSANESSISNSESDVSLSNESKSISEPANSSSADLSSSDDSTVSLPSKSESNNKPTVSASDDTTAKDELVGSSSNEDEPHNNAVQSMPDETIPTEETTESSPIAPETVVKNEDSIDETPAETNQNSPIKSLLNKPSSVIKPLIPPVNQITGALKQSIDWDSVPDKKISTPEADESSESENIPFNTSEADEKPPTISSRPQPKVVDNFVSFGNKGKSDDPEKDPDTAVLSENSPSWKKVIGSQAQGITATIGEQREVLFVIRGMIERVVMKDNGIVTLGRFDTGTVPNAEIDLIPYGALDRGVSRRHCKIQLRDSQLYVTDLQSTNGTFLAGVRLKPQEPTILRKGDEVLLGRLAVQILFR
jgi:hypothetical protein